MIKKGYTLYKSGNYITLTINAGALKYMSQDALYEVHVYTVYMNNEFSQRVQIRTANEEQTPMIFLELSLYLFLSCIFIDVFIKVLTFLN